jgi:hypothetical protein
MGQPAVIRSFILKGLKARVVHTELESVDSPEALALATVTKWPRRFHQVRTDLFDDHKTRRPLTTDLA